MEEKVVKSTIPIYAIGIVWIVYSLMFSMYNISNMVIATFISLIAYIILSKVLPKKIIMVEAKYIPVDTGDDIANKYLAQGHENLKQIKEFNLRLKDSKIANEINYIEDTLSKILKFINKYPKKAKNLRTFIDYYLPTTISLLDNYEHLSSQGLKGENIGDALSKIENVMAVMVDAFKNQLDTLFEDKAIDINAEVSVLKDILKKEGLSEPDVSINLKEFGKLGDKNE